MKGYKEPSHQDRVAAAAQAKNKALAKLKAAPKPDEAELAARAARRVEREAKAEEKRIAAREARQEKQRLAQEKREAAKQERAKANPPKRSEAELKAARDARYAARKSRK
ncbi:DUF6481 family protein [Erythrobacter crassostreae]|uniref:Uncharacterized protein n=1 Tax=Erythrobacter crassostreae TaxID=2828328 RepID=A0A9X1F1M7_9SPHN|nr:DUF6481 family protein [Erythrobacter crassostrea]MBV7258467.1 hypothetical protein [Erythrobacter crassostrea]